ncbi:hypothetical protein FS559_04655 [Treponema phagedenis]|nr:hypothetical protein FS559_04655 [Treponema phagedenis]
MHGEQVFRYNVFLIPRSVFNTSYKKESLFSFCRPWQKLNHEFENSYYTNVVVFKLISAWNHRRPWRF